MLDVVSQTRVSGGNRTHDLHGNSLAYYPLNYQGRVVMTNYVCMCKFLSVISVVKAGVTTDFFDYYTGFHHNPF